MTLARNLSRLLLTSALSLALPLTAAAEPAPDPRAVVVENESRADFGTTVRNLKQQLADDGWNLVAEIDLGARLAKKGVTIPGGLMILELTSGKFSLPLLKEDETRYISALMPCSVSVYGMSDGRVIISRMNAGMMAGMLEPRLADAMRGSAAKLDESIARALAR